MTVSDNFDGCKTSFENKGTDYTGLRNLAVVGLVVITPIAANLMMASWFLSLLNGIPGDEFFRLTQYEVVNQFIKGGLFLLTGSLVVIGTGKLFTTSKGSYIENIIDRVFLRLPIISTVYTTTKTAADTVLQKREFKRPVKLSVNGFKVTGFRTGNCTKDGKILVFVPTSPNITSGFVIEIDEERVESTDEGLEDALKRVLSAGFSN